MRHGRRVRTGLALGASRASRRAADEPIAQTCRSPRALRPCAGSSTPARGEQRADRAAVDDEEHARPGGCARCASTAATIRVAHGGVRLAVLPAVAARRRGARSRPGTAPRSRPSSAPTTRRRRSRAGRGSVADRQAAARRDGLGRLDRAAQVAGVDRLDRHAREPLRECPRLRPPARRSAADRRAPASGARGSSRSRRAGREGSSSRPLG